MIAKAGLGLIGLGAISIGGVAFTKPEWLGINREIPWIPLFKDHGYQDTDTSHEYKDKFGSKYKYYLVGVVGTNVSEGDENTNKDKWNELFEQLKADSLSSEPKKKPSDKFKYEATKESAKVFVAVSKAATDKGLNQICKNIYTTTKDKITEAGTGDNDYKEADVWKYCSGLGQKPTTIEGHKDEDKYGPEAIGIKEKSKLVSVIDPKNNKFWEIRDKEFRQENSYGPIDSSADLFFSKNKKITIKKLCEKAYQEQEDTSLGSSTAEKPKKEQVIKYCSLDKQ